MPSCPFALLRLPFFLMLVLLISSCSGGKGTLHVCCSDSSDLLVILNNQKRIRVVRHATPMEAAGSARPGEAVLVAADRYPVQTTDLPAAFFDRMKTAEVRAYVEYPSTLPGMVVGKPVSSSVERVVVNSDFFNQRPDSLDILVINGLNYVQADITRGHLLAARVAGFDSALFGLPEKTASLLFELPGYPVLVSSTSLTRPVVGRYAPQESWSGVWKGILEYLLPETRIGDPEWTPVVRPRYGLSEVLPNGYRKMAVEDGAAWFTGAGMIVDEGREGSYEAIMSVIDVNGSQPVGTVKRGDCIGETAMAMAAAGSLLDRDDYRAYATNILDFYLVHSDAVRNEWADSTHGAYGLIPWGITDYAWYRANYGDDNARELMGVMVVSALNDTDQWDRTMMRCLLAQLRTTGLSGFRGNRIDLPEFAKNGWEYYFQRDLFNPAPHFEAYLWACFLWAYDKSGFPLFLERARNAIHQTMNEYPDGWQWTNGLAQEKARMILPLAWLVRVDDTPEHREFLMRMVTDLIRLQDSSGAIREELGNLSRGVYPPPQSNEAYGTNEASLIGQNGDLVSDLLYTTNFAFLGLHEAAAATGDSTIRAAEKRLADFLCRIQIHSPSHPELHGGWFRAFDFGRYEHWGCNADHGWGAWCIESGWTQGWITTLLALMEMNTSVWDLTRESKAGVGFDQLRQQMLPDRFIQ